MRKVSMNISAMAQGFQAVLGQGRWDGIDRSKKINYFPNALRHSCMMTGVTFLPLQTSIEPLKIGYEMDMMGYENEMPLEIGEIPYFYCQCCGKLYIPSNLQNVTRESTGLEEAIKMSKQANSGWDNFF